MTEYVVQNVGGYCFKHCSSHNHPKIYSSGFIIPFPPLFLHSRIFFIPLHLSHRHITPYIRLTGKLYHTHQWHQILILDPTTATKRRHNTNTKHTHKTKNKKKHKHTHTQFPRKLKKRTKKPHDDESSIIYQRSKKQYKLVIDFGFFGDDYCGSN